MTPTQIREARDKLGLTQHQLGWLLGYEQASGRFMVSHLERGERDLQEAQRRLLQAYLDGYRPKDWPAPAAKFVASLPPDANWRVFGDKMIVASSDEPPYAILPDGSKQAIKPESE